MRTESLQMTKQKKKDRKEESEKENEAIEKEGSGCERKRAGESRRRRSSGEGAAGSQGDHGMNARKMESSKKETDSYFVFDTNPSTIGAFAHLTTTSHLP